MHRTVMLHAAKAASDSKIFGKSGLGGVLMQNLNAMHQTNTTTASFTAPLSRSSASAGIHDQVRTFGSVATAAAAVATSIPVISRPVMSIPTLPDIEVQREKMAKDLDRIPEVAQANAFATWLQNGQVTSALSEDQLKALQDSKLTKEQVMNIVQSAFMTFLVHVESRSASAMQHGFYTIGPCGEELMSAMALAFRSTDSVALHYRHVGTQIMRQVLAGRSTDDILLDRARGHVVSEKDPVTAGAHCAIGGGPYDFLVTSTLASQACPAVGRAMGAGLSHFLAASPKANGMVPLFPKDMVSFVSVGDGSVNNAHFLSAVNLAEYAQHRKFRCPIVFTVTDNDLCISLKGYDWVKKQFLKKLQMPIFEAKGSDFVSIFTAHEKAAAYARSRGAPAFVYVGGIKRRFGHAATDRQIAYLTPQEIQSLADSNCLIELVNTVVGANYTTMEELSALYRDLWARTRNAFNLASREEKILQRSSSLSRTSVPLTTLPQGSKMASGVYGAAATPSGKIPSYVTGPATSTSEPAYLADAVPDSERGPGTRWNNIQTDVSISIGAPRLGDVPAQVPVPSMPRDVMRKHMTRVFDELLTAYPQMVYIGEDVIHGGYYLVTEQLAAKYPQRVRDFPPDETSLLGAAMGFAQTGMVPIVEMPYAKYLDCGADMFFEAALMSWLSNGKQPNGMIVRLQGFGKGVFGGNFHTHNSLYLPPGIDVVCYSNGQDYAMGMRYAALQASRGRMIMSVDSTHLLNMRHVEGDDDAWRMNFTAFDEFLPFEQVRVYKPETGSGKRTKKSIAVVTYGEGVLTALQARKRLATEFGVLDVTIIDCPLLSAVPQGLKDELATFSSVVFADPCKQRLAPLASHVTALQSEGLLPAKWRLASAQNTYNPLGNTTTFLSPADILYDVLHVMDIKVDLNAEKRERA